MAFLKSHSKNRLEAKKEISLKLGKIWSVINNMAQERRIRSEELEDFNQAYRKLTEHVNTLIAAVESMNQEASEVEKLKLQHAEKLHKMEICLELCGISKNGIDDMMNFPSEFLELVLDIRLKEGKPLETDLDFIWLDLIWKGINLRISNDFESFKQAIFFKKLYHETTSPEQRKMTIKVMNEYAKDLQYLKSKLGKEVDETELTNTITNHWYELYRHNTSENS
jgi:hypothetical protein